jgi:hypothetical protein
MAPRLGLAAAWGIAGVVALLGKAISRLLPLALDLIEFALSPVELVLLVGWVAMMAVAEGYRGFHKQFAPRVVARAVHLQANPRPLLVVLAPIYCMGLIHATRRRKITSWGITLGVIGLVIGVRHLTQPWRGIVDAGVVVGLGIGVWSILYFVVRAARGHVLPVSPDVPIVPGA